jgi:hypothetical protein
MSCDQCNTRTIADYDHVPIKTMLELALGNCDVKEDTKKVARLRT